jgi:hypothetical protein
MIINRDVLAGIQVLKQFLSLHFQIKDLGPLNYFLSLEISSSSNGYYLTQAKYISVLLSQANLINSLIADTAIELNARLNPHDGALFYDRTLYRHLVCSLVCLTITRLDISCVVHLVSQFMDASHSSHFAAVLHIFGTSREHYFMVSISPLSPLRLRLYRILNGFCFSYIEHH